MKCTNCNNELTGSENFCRKCGFPVKKDTDKKEEIKENIIDTNSENSDKLGNTSIDLNDIVSSNSIKKDEKYKIENTQELLVNNTENSKKIKKILDELKFNKKDDNVESAPANAEEVDSSIKKQFEESKKKIANLEEKSANKKTSESVDVENKTIIVEPISLNENSTNGNDALSDNVEERALDNNKEEKEEDTIKDLKVDQEEKEEKNDEIIIDDDNNDEVIYEESSTSSGTGKFVFVLLLFILTLCSSIYLLINNLSLNDKLKKSEDDYNKLSENLSKSNSNVSNSNNNSKSKIYYGCYSLNNNGNININDSSISLIYNNLNIELSSDSDILFDGIKSSKDDYKKLLEKMAYTISSYGTKVIDEREYVFFDASELQGDKYLIVYTSGLKNDSFMFKIKNDEQNINFDNLKIVNQFINAIKCDNSNKITSSDYFIKK